jgi:hypothetical protein
MVSTAPYQTGAVNYAKSHGIARVTVTEGRFLYETKGLDRPAAMSREDAAARFGFPVFVGHVTGQRSRAAPA